MKFSIKNYRFLIIVPLLLFLTSAAILINQYTQTGEWFQRSIELKGGMVITINTQERLDTTGIEASLKQKYTPVQVRETRSLEGFGTLIELSSEVNPDDVLLDLQNLGVDTEDNSIETIGSALGSTFWVQAQLGILLAFIFMGVIVFVLFRTIIPSVAVIISAVGDILMTLAFMQLFGVQLSLAGFAAILMLIGYSVDTDIMLTSRLLRESEEKTTDEKLIRALKTGLTMTLTSMGAMTALLISSISPVLSQIAAVLLIGLTFDIVNTWMTNSIILGWYCERKVMV